jgi:signal transduction histidine kinase
MRFKAPLAVRLGPGRGVVITFAAAVVAPCLLLALLTARAFVVERNAMAGEVRARLDHAADVAAHDLERELNEWLSALGRPSFDAGLGGHLPDSLATFATDERAGAVMSMNGGRAGVWPDNRLLYSPDAIFQSADETDWPPLAEAERLEVREKDYARAALAYERLVRDAPVARNALLVQRLARTLRKAGRHEDSLRAYQQLAAMSDLVAGLPADLIARHEVCVHWAAVGERQRLTTDALALYADLVAGRWKLDKARYLFHAAAARDWLTSGEPAPGLERLIEAEREKRSLSEAVAGLLGAAKEWGGANGRPIFETADRSHVVLMRAVENGEANSAPVMVISRSWLGARVWPRTFARAVDEGFDVALTTAADGLLFATSAENDAASVSRPPETVRPVKGHAGWRIHVRPHDVASFTAGLNRRQTVYLVALILVVSLLGFGTVLTASAVRQELAVARLKADFVATVSHEFRSPLTGIRQLSEMLARGRVPNDERRQQYYERLTLESDRLARLVENVLDFSRMEEGRKKYHFEPVDSGRWLRALIADVRLLLDERISLVTTLDEDLPRVVADREALTSAIRNLLDNAVKYSPGRATIWLSAAATGEGVAISVRDEGIGISEADQRHIFDKFYRADSEVTREVKGVGLGLSLVHHIVSAHGGRVDCASRPNEGSTFTIHLPPAPASTPAPTADRAGATRRVSPNLQSEI